jgi:hypothetical protein
VYRPVNYIRGVVTTVSLLGAGGVIFKLAPYILPIIQNRNVWAGLSLIGILLFTSGHMFNQIRKVPYVAGDGRGGISYFAGGFQSQYGLETQIVAFICKHPMKSHPRTHLLIFRRWSPIICHHITCFKSAKNTRCKCTANHGDRVGYRNGRYVQLFTICFPGQERRVPFQTPTFYVS